MHKGKGAMRMLIASRSNLHLAWTCCFCSFRNRQKYLFKGFKGQQTNKPSCKIKCMPFFWPLFKAQVPSFTARKGCTGSFFTTSFCIGKNNFLDYFTFSAARRSITKHTLKKKK